MSFINTNDLCTGCNKCIRNCPVFPSNSAVENDEVNVVLDACIDCGECIDVCTHNAREYTDDTKEFIEYMMPVYSPVMCMAKYLKKYEHITEKIAFLSPCIAKKSEINDKNCEQLISYNVTFNNFMDYIGDAYKTAREYNDV